MFMMCQSIGFNRTAFPNVVGNINLNNMQMLSFLDMILNINAATKCYEYTALFVCSVYIPKCSGTPVIPNHIIPPCRSLCQAFKANCFVFWEIFAMPWPNDLDCSSLPDSNDSSVCIGYKEANESPPVRVKLGNGTDSGRLLVYNAAGLNEWEEACTTNWNSSLSEIVCSQLGYKEVLAYEEVAASSGPKSTVTMPSAESLTHLIQSYLVKSTGSSCPNGKVVKLTCGNPECGTRPAYYPSPLRVVNGDEVKPGTWPFVVEMLGGPRKLHFCGAAVIAQNWVITAAHCIGAKRNTDGIYLNIGDTRRFTYSQYRQIRQGKTFYVHPDYSSVTVEHDIALIELDEPIHFNDYVRPVCLPGSSDVTPVGTRCYVAGWGKAGDKAPDYEPALMEVNLDVVNWQKCKEDIKDAPITSPFTLTSDMMCAGGGRDHDACSGDSGGALLCPTSPLADTWRATGIVSWGLGYMFMMCQSIGFNRTAFPNVVGNINLNNMQMLSFLDMILNINAATKCYEYTALFVCSVYIPKCSGTPVIPNHIIPPCRSLCQAFKANCFVFWEIFAMPWPNDLDCSSLPDSNDSSVCIGYKEANESPPVRVKLGNGTDSGRLLVYNAAGFNEWEEACTTNWNSSLSEIVCSQLGYKEVLAYEEVAASSGPKSTVTMPSVESLTHLIQSYLVKSTGSSCPNGKVVKLTCGNPECGTRPAYYPSPLRVVNGDEVKPGTWPFVVEMLGGPRKLHFCGAAVIAQNWVITAAHCIGAKRNTDGIYLNIGDTRRFAYSQYRQIRQGKTFYVHPDYSSVTVEHDIALIELDEPIHFNDYVRPVCLPGSSDVTPVGTRCYVAGWGKAGDKAPDYEPALMEVNLDVVNWKKCKEDIKDAPITSPFTLTSDMMCAGGGLDHDACSGDSGGALLCPTSPLVDTWRATGIVSWGLGCAVPNVPGVYTQVSKYATWIRNVTRNEVHIL
ncbi:hypothetical protein FSP39_023749 [Pinctada imbricata]|uniref:Uncharacterized protein n=1 Tax=Pinctada imbricata TaxID=66713 RepID=A0AA88XT84_PINIB|nr:hypothetical protein FSP39_023749 [Pinctada imbricata]